MKGVIKTVIVPGILLMLLMTGNSCRKFVTIPPPENQLVTSTVFADSADATTAVLGIYINMMETTGYNFPSGGITRFCGLAADELYPNTGSADDNEYFENAIPSTSNETSVFWTGAYQYVYQANACIAGLTASTGLSNSCKNQLMGESLVVRAFLYFNMVNLWGPVPLVTSTDYKVNESMPRTSRDSVYQQIIADLQMADSLMTAAYPSTGRLRPNQYTAAALLAKVYLYLGQWANAGKAASQVLSSGLYSLVPNLNNVFLPGSNETIWQLSPILQGYETPDGMNFVQFGVIPSYVITNNLLSAYEPGDQRFVDWLDSNEVNGTAYYFPYKYQLGYDGWPNGGPSEDYIVFRLGEQYLIRAEAEAETGDSTDAIIDLNVIRSRAQLPNYNPVNQGGLLAAIQHERRIEMAYEWGNRWFDLKRTGTINNILGTVEMKPGWQATDSLLPIPLGQIQSNPYLIQNLGY
jgi:hypothetical protein